MKPKKLLTTFLILMVVLIAGCKKDDFIEVVGVCPVVISTNPANNATGVPIDKIISVSFNEEMNPATITEASFSLTRTNKNTGLKELTTVPGIINYNGVTATFTPTGTLSPNTIYTGRVSTAVRDLRGNALQFDYVWSFVTGFTIAPRVISTNPEYKAIGVFLNKTLSATFSQQMEPLSFSTSTFLIKQAGNLVPGTVWGNAGMIFFNPTVDLLFNTTYTAIISENVKNIWGTSMTNDYEWTFSTGSIIAPMVITTDPFNTEINVILSKTVSATFSEPMDPFSFNNSSFTLKIGLTNVAGTITLSGSTVFFKPDCNLFSGTTYTGTLTTGVRSLAGIPLANDYTWTFDTKTHSGPTIVNLKSASGFGILAGTGISNNAGISEILNLNVGISPGIRSSITGFPPAIIVNGAIYASDDIDPPGVPAMLVQAKQDLTDAYLFAEGSSFPAPATVSGDLGGTTLYPGIYKSTSSLLIQSGDLILDAQGDMNAVWIFQIASDFTSIGGAGGNVILIGGAQSTNIFWQVGSSATIGDFTSFKGNMLALTSITMNSGANVTGRMLARNGAVVLTNSNTINKP